MTEYWLQKKTIGGWTTVSWWSVHEFDKATNSYLSCSKGDSGYSWRLVEIKVTQQKLLEDHIEVEPEALPAIERSGWGSEPINIKSDSNNSHGMVGKAWLIHHARKERKRVDPSEVDAMLKDGWERGGPKTAFRESKSSW